MCVYYISIYVCICTCVSKCVCMHIPDIHTYRDTHIYGTGLLQHDFGKLRILQMGANALDVLLKLENSTDARQEIWIAVLIGHVHPVVRLRRAAQNARVQMLGCRSMLGSRAFERGS